ncbi:MAG: hydrolase, partial [Ruminococcus sp.]|nr:hydrolase [Ruminococcus sp.]
AMAIRWHMGEFGDKNSNVISQAYDKYPLAVKLHLADLESTFLREKGYSQVK